MLLVPGLLGAQIPIQNRKLGRALDAPSAPAVDPGGMYTFCFAVSNSSDTAERCCIRALTAVRSTLCDLGSPGRIESGSLPEARAAFATLKPETDLSPSRVQVSVIAELAVVVFGEQAGNLNLAASVQREFLRAGVDGVSQMTGNLSAVIVERVPGRVWICGTLLGHRSLVYHASGPTLVVSPHDLTLLGTGQVPFDLDPMSLASSVGCDWSLMGRSLLSQVERCHPMEAMLWEGGRIRRQHLSSPVSTQRIDPADRSAMRRQVEAVAEGLITSVRERLRGAEKLHCSLTAGMDSRAVFAAISGAAAGRPIYARTTGGDRSLDVVVARRLAALVGASHTRKEPDRPVISDFAQVSRLMAFFCSGDTSAKRAMTHLPRLDPHAELTAGGNGGEIFRGFFYQYFGAAGVAPNGVEALAEQLTRWRFRRLANLPFRDPAFQRGVRDRLLQTLVYLQRWSSNTYDMADLLYLFERYGRWGAMQANSPWRSSWTPFESVVAIREAMKLPPPVGKNCPVHSLLIRRFLPRAAFWIPINGGQFLALEGPGRLRYAMRQGLNLRSLLIQKVQRRWHRASSVGDDVKARYFAEDLKPFVDGLIDAEGSLSRELFGRDGARALLDSHHAKRNQLAVLGILAIAEQWRHLALEVRDRSTAIERSS